VIFERLSYLAVIILAISSLFLLLSQNWRWSIVALAAQYLAVFWLVGLLWPLGLATAKLVSGWMAGAVLGASQPLPSQVEDSYTGSATFVFRLLVAFLVWIVVLLAAPALVQTLKVPLPVAQATLLLIGMGLIHLGITTRPLRVLLGLLTVLAGFELIYAAVETSVLVAGLLAVVTLGLALVGAYLLEPKYTRSVPPESELAETDIQGPGSQPAESEPAGEDVR
jgi:hypothetical protein